MRIPKIVSRASRSSLFGSALLLAALCILTQSAAVQAQTTQNKIAFSRDSQIWTMNGDGTEQTSQALRRRVLTRRGRRRQEDSFTCG